LCHNENMLEVHAILQRQRCNENITKKTGTLSDAYLHATLYSEHTSDGGGYSDNDFED